MAEQTPDPTEVRNLVARVVAELAPEADAATPGPAPASPGVLRPGELALTDIAVGSDHGGFHLKQRIAAELRDRGFAVRDCGTHSTDPADYPDSAHAVARAVALGECQAGIVVDGAGIGSAIAANKVPGVRAATCWDVSSARNSREHNHANVLALGAGLLGESLALQVVSAWLATGWGGERHARRVAKIALLEERYARGLA